MTRVSICIYCTYKRLFCIAFIIIMYIGLPDVTYRFLLTFLHTRIFNFIALVTFVHNIDSLILSLIAPFIPSKVDW